MTDLTQDERRALDALIAKSIVHGPHAAATYESIWRAARAFENEECAKVCEEQGTIYAADFSDKHFGPKSDACIDAAKAIRERAKGLT